MMRVLISLLASTHVETINSTLYKAVCVFIDQFLAMLRHEHLCLGLRVEGQEVEQVTHRVKLKLFLLSTVAHKESELVWGCDNRRTASFLFT